MRPARLAATAATLLLLATGAASAASVAPPPDTGTTVDPDLYVSPDGCEDCYGASLTVLQVMPGCYDCPGIYVDVGVHGSGKHVQPHHRACITGYSPICVLR